MNSRPVWSKDQASSSEPCFKSAPTYLFHMSDYTAAAAAAGRKRKSKTRPGRSCSDTWPCRLVCRITKVLLLPAWPECGDTKPWHSLCTILSERSSRPPRRGYQLFLLLIHLFSSPYSKEKKKLIHCIPHKTITFQNKGWGKPSESLNFPLKMRTNWLKFGL